MKSIILAVTFFLIACGTVFAAEDAPTKNDAKALVKQAVTYYKEHGRDKFFNEVRTPAGKVHFKEGTKKGLYIFVYDEKGVVWPTA